MEKIYRFNYLDEIYELIYGCELKFDSVDAFIRYINTKDPPGWCHQKIQKHDIIFSKGKYYFILSIGEDEVKYIFIDDIKRIAYGFTDRKTITTVMVEPRLSAYELRITNSLEAMQSAVRGDIECFYIDDPEKDISIAYVNDEGISLNMPPNRFIRGTIIFGNMIIVGSDGDGNDISLTREQVDKYLAMFGDIYNLTLDPESGTLFIT